MMLDLENARWRRTAMWTIIAVSLTVHVLALVLGHTIFSGWRWSHLPMHAAAEMAGSVIALMVAYFLVSLERRGEGGSHNGIIAAALVGMGVLDGLHALVQAGETFVWLHSTATLAGGGALRARLVAGALAGEAGTVVAAGRAGAGRRVWTRFDPQPVVAAPNGAGRRVLACSGGPERWRRAVALPGGGALAPDLSPDPQLG